MLTLTPKQNVAWRGHLERSELRRHLFYGGARSGKTDVILGWRCIQAMTYPGARILMARRMRIAAARVQNGRCAEGAECGLTYRPDYGTV
ncbi:MAG: hypothetical protein Q8O57_02090 [Kiritimatiellota bacterium]|nr:hypothetical protein [Kiritimatiellota bacterium]